MKFERSIRERLVDGLLTLVLLGLCATGERNVIGDRLKVTKLVFLACHDLFSRQVKAFNFSFYRFHYGPFTTELYETWGELGWMDFLEVGPGNKGDISLTPTGIQAAERYRVMLEDLGNDQVLGVFRQVADTFGELSTDEVLRQVYAKEVIPVGWGESILVREMPHEVYLTGVLDQREARAAVRLDDDVLREFFGELPEIEESRKRAGVDYAELYDSARRGLAAKRNGAVGIEVSVRELERKLGGGGA